MYFIICSCDIESGDSFSPLKLQKLLYYAQAWYLAIHKKPLFNEEFEAWVHGPVIPELWRYFSMKKMHGWESITFEDVKNLNVQSLDDETIQFLTDIIDDYGKYSAKYLEGLTHSEDPWINARVGYSPEEKSNVIIKKDDIKKYYESKI